MRTRKAKTVTVERKKREKKKTNEKSDEETEREDGKKETRTKKRVTFESEPEGDPGDDPGKDPGNDPPSSDEEEPSSDEEEPSSEEESENEGEKKKRGKKVVEFARSPGMANRFKLLNFKKAAMIKFYTKATKELLPELYDCEPDRMYAFLKALKRRAKEYGWMEPGSLLCIPYDVRYPDEDFINLITDYGMISEERVRKHEETYVNKPVRLAQDNNILFNCLMESLSESAKNKIQIWENDYVVNDEYSGLLLLKVIIRESHLDTNATTSATRMKLNELHEYIRTIDSDITKFNTYVQLLVDTLASRGEKTEDLVVNLFKAYKCASDKNFVKYIIRKEDENDEKSKGIKAHKLMKLADNRFRLLKSRGEWNAPTEEEENILALGARFDKFEKKQRTLMSTAGKGRERDQGGGRRNTRGRDRERSTNRGGRGGDRIPKPAWFDKEPKPEDLHKPMQWKGVNWYYCSPATGGKCNGKHRRHKPKECKGLGYNPAKDKGHKRGNDTTSDDKNKRSRLAKAYQAVRDDTNQDDTEYSSDE